MTKIRLKKQIPGILLNLYKNAPFISSRLKYLLEVNQLFTLDSTNSKKIKLSAEISWKIKKDKKTGDKLLILDFYDMANLDFRSKIEDLQGCIQSLFETYVLEKIKNFNYTRFICPYKTKKEDPHFILGVKTEKACTGQIPLNKYYKWDFSNSSQSHFLICGASGSGKSRYLHYLVNQLANQNFKTFLVDGKQSELREFGRMMQVYRNAETYEDVKEVIFEAEREMINRTFAEPFALVIDELASLQLLWNKKESEEVMRSLTNFCLRARSSGGHLILALQRPSASAFFNNLAIRDQCGIRIALGNSTKESLAMMFDITSKTEDIVSRGTGQGYLSICGSELKYFDCPKILFPHEIEKE